MKKIYSLLITSIFSLIIHAQPAALDPSFVIGAGANGHVRVISQQPDGKILIGGNFNMYDGTSRSKIARINTDGSLDGTFNPGTGADNDVYAIAVQTDGKIIIAGDFTTYNGTSKNRIARLNSDGTLDGTFLGSGTNGPIRTLSLQSDGKIIMGGNFSTYDALLRSCLARANTNGSCDVSFNPGAGASNQVSSSTIQPDGKIIIGGLFGAYDGIARTRVARVNSDGSCDLTFDPGTGVNNDVKSILIQTDGKIIIAGQFSTYNGTSSSRIARILTNGTLDPTFLLGTGANAIVHTAALQSDGKIIIGGVFTSYNGTPIARVARINTDGSIDLSFNPGTGPNNYPSSSYVQSDGKILIGGLFYTYDGTDPVNFIARLNGDFCALLSQPDPIVGLTSVCNGNTNTYSVTNDPLATSYTWTLPGGWSGTSTTNTINTTASATSGDITVTANNACGSSTVQTLAITVDAIPATPGAISGTTTICSGSSNTYSITAVAGATSYTWTLPGGWSGTSTTNTINTTASATSGDVTVTANNACGNSTAATLAITVNDVPAMPSSITGNASFCEDATAQTYSVTNDVSATSYTWTLPIGWSGTSTTNSINSTAGASGGTITVSANNACGASAVQSLVVTINPLPVVSLALAVDTVCEKSEAFTLTGSSPSGGTFSGTGVSGSTFDPDAAGAGTHVITYTYTDGNSCTNSATDNMVVDLCLGISSGSDLTNHFSVYPNPTNSLVTIETKNGQEKNVVIYNSMGQIVFTQLMMTDKLMIDMSAFNSGIYLIQLQSENGFSSEIIVKQ
jgi:uncharacterized delta-60 repeat protein